MFNMVLSDASASKNKDIGNDFGVFIIFSIYYMVLNINIANYIFWFCSIAHNVYVPFFGMFSLNYLNIVIICFCFVKKDKNIRRPCCKRKRQGACRPGQQQEQQKASPSFLESFGYEHILQEGHSVFKSLIKSEIFTCCFKELPPSLLGTSFHGLLKVFFLFPN